MKIPGRGGSFTLTLPQKWVDACGLKPKDKVIVRYNSILKVIPRIYEDFKVKKDGETITFQLYEREASLNLTKVREFIKKYGLEDTCRLIKTELVKQKEFPPNIPVSKIYHVLDPDSIVFEE